MVFWKKVQSEMFRRNGCTKTPRQCETKWKLLNREYKNILFKKSKTGSSPVLWVFFDDMHEVMFHRAEINPPALASNIEGYRRRVLEKIQKTSEGSNDEKKKKKKEEEELEEKMEKRNEELEDEEEKIIFESKGFKKRRRNPKKSSFDLHRAEAQIRHEENLERKDRLLLLLSDLVKEKQKNN